MRVDNHEVARLPEGVYDTTQQEPALVAFIVSSSPETIRAALHTGVFCSRETSIKKSNHCQRKGNAEKICPQKKEQAEQEKEQRNR